MMLNDITHALPLPDYCLKLTFEDGISGIVDVRQLVPFTGVFEPLQDVAVFNQVRVDSDLGTVCWPSGADLDPHVLYVTITGQSLPHMPTITPEAQTSR
jgi:Protein of unknown function (DUF2442)